MINNILDLAKLEAGQRDLHPQLVPLRPLLQETADLLEPQAREKGLDLNVEISPDLPETAVLDREKVSRVLINLLSNAVKYTQRGNVTRSRDAVAGQHRLRGRGHRERRARAPGRHRLRAVPPDPHGRGRGAPRHGPRPHDLQAARRADGRRPHFRQPRGGGNARLADASEAPGHAGRGDGSGFPAGAARRGRPGRVGELSSSRTTRPRATASRASWNRKGTRSRRLHCCRKRTTSSDGTRRTS